MNKLFFYACPVVIILMAVAMLTPRDILTARGWASYQAGDCLRTPSVDANLERWDVREPDTILMVSEVGQQHYRTREWGRRFSNSPQWYANYDTRLFAHLDDRQLWSTIPCPQQGPDEPEIFDHPLLPRDVTYSFSQTRGNSVTIFRNNIVNSQNSFDVNRVE